MIIAMLALGRLVAPSSGSSDDRANAGDASRPTHCVQRPRDREGFIGWPASGVRVGQTNNSPTATFTSSWSGHPTRIGSRRIPPMTWPQTGRRTASRSRTFVVELDPFSGHIRVMSSLGKSDRQVSDFPVLVPATWSPDDRYIVAGRAAPLEAAQPGQWSLSDTCAGRRAAGHHAGRWPPPWIERQNSHPTAVASRTSRVRDRVSAAPPATSTSSDVRPRIRRQPVHPGSCLMCP